MSPEILCWLLYELKSSFELSQFSVARLMYSITEQVAGRSLGELVRKLGERVLPSIIPILAKGLEDEVPSTRQVCLFSFRSSKC